MDKYIYYTNQSLHNLKRKQTQFLNHKKIFIHKSIITSTVFYDYVIILWTIGIF